MLIAYYNNNNNIIIIILLFAYYNINNNNLYIDLDQGPCLDLGSLRSPQSGASY